MFKKFVPWRLSHWLIAALFMLLTACGGGGGGSSGGASNTTASYADGLGVSGLAPGTIVIGHIPNPLGDTYIPHIVEVSVAQDGDGRALAVWFMHDPAYTGYAAAWNRSDSSGQWGVQQPLIQAIGSTDEDGIVLRMNASGSAVLGWINNSGSYRAARFINGTGWDATFYDASGGAIPSFSTPNGWDLSMLADDSFVTSVSIADSANATYSFWALRQPTNGPPIFSLGISPADARSWSYSFLASRPDGTAMLSWVVPSAGSPGKLDVMAELGSVYSVAFAPFTIGTYPWLCYFSSPFYSEFRPLIVATSPTFHSALAVVASDVAGASKCLLDDLELIRLDTRLGINIASTRANSAGTVITATPVVVMDKNGNALAVWKEASTTLNLEQAQLMWSASLQGGPWSPAQPVISNLSEIGIVTRFGETSLAMNDNGQVIAAVVTNDSGQPYNPSVSYGQFSFTSGWTAWKRVANKYYISDPKVAINQSGKAIIVYSAMDVDRYDGQATLWLWPGSAPDTNIYAFSP